MVSLDAYLRRIGLRRRLSDEVFRRLLVDEAAPPTGQEENLAVAA